MRVFCCAIVFAFLMSPSIVRTQTFSRVAITPSASTDTRETRLRILPSGDLLGQAIPFVELLSLAYDVPDNLSPRVSQLPEWTVRQRFNIEARVPTSLKLDSKDAATQQRAIQQLIRNLLADRFGLEITFKIERMPVYGLFVAKGGPKLKRAALGNCILDTNPEGCHSFEPGFGHPLNASAVNMSDLSLYLENWTDLPVVDRTALSGLFMMHSQGWRPMKLPPPPPGTTGSGSEFASLPPLSAVLGSFGLLLRRQEESLPLYTVERVHQPSAK